MALGPTLQSELEDHELGELVREGHQEYLREIEQELIDECTEDDDETEHLSPARPWVHFYFSDGCRISPSVRGYADRYLGYIQEVLNAFHGADVPHREGGRFCSDPYMDVILAERPLGHPAEWQAIKWELEWLQRWVVAQVAAIGPTTPKRTVFRVYNVIRYDLRILFFLEYMGIRHRGAYHRGPDLYARLLQRPDVQPIFRAYYQARKGTPGYEAATARRRKTYESTHADERIERAKDPAYRASQAAAARDRRARAKRDFVMAVMSA